MTAKEGHHLLHIMLLCFFFHIDVMKMLWVDILLKALAAAAKYALSITGLINQASSQY